MLMSQSFLNIDVSSKLHFGVLKKSSLAQRQITTTRTKI
ncbi:hypothetical protein ABEDC_1312 [Acinetobacter lwoffii]|nr:hypothetical protein ABEDC_1312 [Acinetobacter lwoffii]